MEIPGPVEPREIVEAGRIDDQGFSLPPAIRPSHPTIRRRFLVLVHVDRADRTGKGVDHHDVLLRLEDLERRRHVVGARHTRQITFDFRVERQALFEVLFLSRGRRRLIGERAALDDPETRNHGACGSKRCHRPWRSAMALDIPIRFGERLPDTIEVGFAVRGTRRSVRAGLASSRYCGEPEDGTGRDGRHYRASQQSSHQIQLVTRRFNASPPD